MVMKRVLGLTLMAALSLNLASTAGATSEPGFFETTVTIGYDRAHGSFKGRVDNEKMKCRSRREVIIRRGRWGHSVDVASVIAGPRGKWRLPAPEDPGRYFAVVKTTNFTDREGEFRICGRGHSAGIRR
jgi:hypothetical protein